MDFSVNIFLVYSFVKIVNSCFPSFISVLPSATCVSVCMCEHMCTHVGASVHMYEFLRVNL